MVKDNGEELQIVRKLSWILDSCIPIPGTKIRVGLDPILGLIPGVGDAIGAAMSSYLIILAANVGASRWTLLRMLFNVALEALVGLIPFVGDFFDAAWKANQKNLLLLEKSAISPGQKRVDRGFVLLVLSSIVLIVGLAAWGTFELLRALIQLFQS